MTDDSTAFSKKKGSRRFNDDVQSAELSSRPLIRHLLSADLFQSCSRNVVGKKETTGLHLVFVSKECNSFRVSSNTEFQKNKKKKKKKKNMSTGCDQTTS